MPSTAPAAEGEVQNVPGNHFDKHNSNNPIVTYLMNRFHVALLDATRDIEHATILDVGCGEGRTTTVIAGTLDSSVVGVDLEESVIREARILAPQARFATASALDLPFADGSFDAVLATEMLEHLDQPRLALHEMVRVARSGVVVTVPHEPWWRIANVARGRYLKAWGNTPGHVQHWSPGRFRAMLEEFSRSVQVDRAGLWLVGVIKV